MSRLKRSQLTALVLLLAPVATNVAQEASPGQVVAGAVTRWARMLHSDLGPLDFTVTAKGRVDGKARDLRFRLMTDGAGTVGAELSMGKKRLRAFMDETRSLLCVDHKQTAFEGRGKPGEVSGCPVTALLKRAKDGLPAGAQAMVQSPEQLGGLVGILAMQYVDVAGKDDLDGRECIRLRAKPAAKIGSAEAWLAGSMPVRAKWVSRDQKSNVELTIQAGGQELDSAVPEATTVVSVPRDELDRTLVRGLARAITILVEKQIPPVGLASAREAEGGKLLPIAGKQVALLCGSHRQMGRQHGKLLASSTCVLMDTVLYTIGLYASIDSGKWFLDTLREARRRTWPHTPQCYKEEMAGLAEGSGLPREIVEIGTSFPEYFHCSGFAVWGKATTDGKLYHGRVLDYMREVGFQHHATVFVCKPDQGHAFVNVGYAGFIGCVTGMNERQVAVGEMGGGGVGEWDGLSMGLLMRHVLENADSLNEAVSIFRDTPRTCEYYYVVSDGKIPDARGLWTTPKKFIVIEPNKPHERLPIPVENAVLMSSGNRYKALVANTKAAFGQIDAAGARTLADRKVVIPNGNLHNVVFAPQTLELWVQDASARKPAFKMPYAHLDFGQLLRMMAQDAIP